MTKSSPGVRGHRARSSLLWAFVLSIVVHGVLGPLVLRAKSPPADEREPTPVAISTAQPIVLHTAPPTPPPAPTPVPRRTQPPVARREPPRALHVRAPKQTAHASRNSRTDSAAVVSSIDENGTPDVIDASPGGARGTSPVASAAPTDAPATPASTPTPSMKPRCASPNVDAAVISKALPDYPDIAREQGVVGTASVIVTLSATGSVLDVAVRATSGSAVLDREALRAARASTYAPEISNCEKVGGSYLFVAEFDSQ